jgi:hypothetical protein
MVNLPLVRIDTRFGAWMPPHHCGRRRKIEGSPQHHGERLPRYADETFLALLMAEAQIMVDHGHRLKAVLHGMAAALAPTPGQRGEVEAELYRAWNRHRAWLRAERERQRNVLHEFPRRYRTR